MAVITMFRQAGCKGRYIAEEVARALSYDFADYRTAERLLLQFGLTQVPEVYQSTPDFWDHFTRKGPERDHVNAMLRSVTLAQAQHGNVVLLGRGCFAPLQGLSDVLNVRVKAPLPLRIERVMQDYEMTRDEAIAFVREKDDLVAAFAPTSYGAIAGRSRCVRRDHRHRKDRPRRGGSLLGRCGSLHVRQRRTPSQRRRASGRSCDRGCSRRRVRPVGEAPRRRSRPQWGIPSPPLTLDP